MEAAPLKKPPKVRFLKDAELDSAAGELLRKFAKSLGRPVAPPIPIEDVIEKYLRVTLEICDLRAMLGEDVLGATWFDENLIRVDESLEAQEGRYCFTLAHEVGHWVLHRPQYEADKVTGSLFKREDSREAEPAIVCRSSQRREPAEWQADQFAARVLMPARFVRDAFAAVAGGEPLALEAGDSTRLGSLRDVAALVMRRGNFENVSNEAMRIRLRTLGLVADGRTTARGGG